MKMFGSQFAKFDMGIMGNIGNMGGISKMALGCV